MSSKNQKKLRKKILDICSNLATQDSREDIKADQVLSALKKEPPFSRLPEGILLKEINEFLTKQNQKKQVEKQAPVQLNFMNKSLPFMKQHEKNIAKQQEEDKDNESNIYKKVKLNNEELLNSVPNLSELGGIKNLVSELLDFIELPLQSSNIVSQLNITWRRGILLTGLPGSGKTTIVFALFLMIIIFFKALSICKYMNKQYGISFFYKSSTEIIGGISGESENNIRTFFNDACKNAPSIVFLDDIDQIGGGETGLSGSKDMLKRMTCQLSQSLDNLPSTVFVIGATSKPENLSTQLRRSGRFDRELTISIPDEPERLEILEKLLNSLPIPEKEDLMGELAKKTSGYVASDLTSLIREAGFIATKRIVEQKIVDNITFCKEDFIKGTKQVQPTGLREGFATIPDVTFDDIGALEGIRTALYNSIILPIKTPLDFTRFNMNRSAGVLLYGPPGCGKTLIAKAIANESHAHFISIRGPELIDKFVGETERAIRQVFNRARMQKPCVIFFDEVDAICQKRDERAEAFGKRLVNQLLVELDGWELRTDVYVIAATNRPEIIDEAVLRQGRLGEKMYVGVPNQKEREDILRTLLRKVPVCWEEIKVDKIASSERVERFSGADLAALVREAGMQAILEKSDMLRERHFVSALEKSRPSISLKELERYEKLQEKFEKFIK